jgi:hypothetical protein
MPDSDIALLEQSADLRNGQAKADGPTDLIWLAVERGMPPDGIAKLVALVEGRERIAAERAFTDAMRSVQQAAVPVFKNATNSQTHKSYADLEGINRVMKPVYTKHGFALSFAEGDSPIEGWKRTVCDVRHSGGHSVRYHLDLPLDGVGGKGNAIGSMNPIQAAVSTGTYGQRVLICRVFNLTLTDDQDGVDDRPIDADEIAELESLIETFKDAISPKPFHFDKFLKVFGGPECERLSDLTLSQFEEARRDLRSQIAGAKKGAK